MNRSALIYLVIAGVIAGYMLTQLVFTYILHRKIPFHGSRFIVHWMIAVGGTLCASAALILLRNQGLVIDILILAALYFSMMQFLVGFCVLRQIRRPDFVARLGIALVGASAAAISAHDVFWVKFACASIIQAIIFGHFTYVAGSHIRLPQRRILSDGLFFLTSGILFAAASWRAFGALERREAFMFRTEQIDMDALQLYSLTVIGILTCGGGLVVAFLERVLEITRYAERHDELTGLPNRRAVNAAGEREVELALRNGHGLVVALVDIDFFKRINDEHGHDVGDGVLREVAAALAADRRSSDLVGRYGGEEFCLLFPGDDRAQLIGQRLVDHVRQHDFGAYPNATVSVGLATLRPGQQNANWQDLLKAADLALYEAKRAGRDRAVVHASPPAGESTAPPALISA